MMKIFSTQLQGLFQKINDQEEMNIEDGARLLAQAAIGQGKIYIHGFHELEAVVIEAISGVESLDSCERLFKNGKMNDVTEGDRVLIITRFSTDPDALELVTDLKEKGIQTVVISAIVDTDEPSLDGSADVHIDSKLVKALIPDDEGNRYGFPSIMTALFAYYGLFFTLKEIITEYE